MPASRRTDPPSAAHAHGARRRRAALLTSVVAAALAALALAAAPPAPAAAAKTCALSGADQQPAGGKPTYNLALTAKKTACATARKVMRAFHACRATTAVTCSRKVLSSWTCTGRKTADTTTIFYATLSCRSGAKRVTSSYQQNT
jgi:hypothetical protein